MAVIDIDGVVADVRHRLQHVARAPKDWDAFFAGAPDDEVLAVGVDTVRRLAEVCEIVYLSGRPEWCRRDTRDWLARHALPPGDLHLRPRNDRRPARLIKVEALDRLSERGHVTVLVETTRRCAPRRVLPGTTYSLPTGWGNAAIRMCCTRRRRSTG